MTIREDLKSRNFSIYGQWCGIITFFLCIALGIANIFHFGFVILFSVLAFVQGLIVLFVEAPFLLRICPLSEKFAEFIRRFNSNWARTLFYAVNALIQFLSLTIQVTSLLVIAIAFTFCAICYLLAALTHQEFTGSSTLGGKELANTAGHLAVNQAVNQAF